MQLALRSTQIGFKLVVGNVAVLRKGNRLLFSFYVHLNLVGLEGLNMTHCCSWAVTFSVAFALAYVVGSCLVVVILLFLGFCCLVFFLSL